MNPPDHRISASGRLSRAFFEPRLLLLAAVLLMPVAPAMGAAAGQDSESRSEAERPRMSEAVAIEIGKIQPLLDNRQWAEAMLILEKTLAKCKQGSYDESVVGAVLAQTHLQRGTKDDYEAAIPLLERAIDSGYYDTARSADFVFLVAQLYLQKNDAVRAEAGAKRHLEMVPRPLPDRIVFHSSLVLTRLQSEKNVDSDRFLEVLAEVDRGLHLSVKPNEQLLVLKVVTLQALERFDDAAELLELLVKLHPENKQYWPQLFSLYVNNRRDLPAILTLERAQARGLMNTPRENFALVSLYYNMEHYTKAIDLLQKGLADGAIEPVEQNWELLAFAYQRTNRPERAIDVYKQAAERIPGGRFDAQIANIQFNLGNLPEAFEHARAALTKGGTDRPEQLATFAAFLGYELKRHREALEILDHARPLLKTERDRDEYNRLRKAIEDALRVQESNKAA